MKYIIGYHANCNDGLMAAACIAYAIADLDNAVFHDMDYSEKSESAFVDLVLKYASDPLEFVDVMVVDYCPKAATLKPLSWLVTNCVNGNLDVTVLDHHETSIAKEAVNYDHPDYPGISFIYDAGMSGAGLAWEYIADYVSTGSATMPPAVAYVQDRDLWKFELGTDTKNFHAYTRLVDRTPQAWYRAFLNEDTLTPMCDILAKGEMLIKEDEVAIANHMKNTKFQAICVNDLTAMAAIFKCDRKDLVSEICHKLLQAHPNLDLAFCVTELAEGSEGYVWSVRSTDETPSCISAQSIAKHFGGGGHRNAAGFKTATFFEVVSGCNISFSDLGD